MLVHISLQHVLQDGLVQSDSHGYSGKLYEISRSRQQLLRLLRSHALHEALQPRPNIVVRGNRRLPPFLLVTLVFARCFLVSERMLSCSLLLSTHLPALPLAGSSIVAVRVCLETVEVMVLASTNEARARLDLQDEIQR